MSRMNVSGSMILALVSLTCTGSLASAQEVRWRHDYVAARKEATETGRALLLDFGTEACVWCRKLDATTFRDPKIVKLLNERFIPVKVDAQKEERLTNALGIEGFPTLILATPDGKVVGRHSGYADVVELSALLSKAPTHSPAATTPQAPTVPTRPAATIRDDSEVERRKVKDQIDADLAALHPKIAAALDR